MKEPILVVMAAGMGSRYGGLKQIDPVGEYGEIIIDFSLYDAVKAGFKRAVFIIKEEMEKDFKEIIGDRISKIMEVHYAYQRNDDLPIGYQMPKGRIKPWGTGHAVLCCREFIDAPFAVINADDFYGQEAFSKIYRFLCETEDSDQYDYAMVGYVLENTLTENGHVARGVCETEDRYLKNIVERTHIERRGDSAEFTEDGGETWTAIPRKSTVSMNLWGFTPSMIEELKKRFPAFLDSVLAEDPLKGEYFLPTVVNELLMEQKVTVRVLHSQDKWYGVTYRKAKPGV